MEFKILLSAVLLAAMSSGSVTLHESNVTFKQALKSCSGALGSVSFALGHARVAGSSGVKTDESAPDDNGMLTVMFQSTSGGKSAKVSIDQKRRSVSAKNVHSSMRGSVACILAD